MKSMIIPLVCSLIMTACIVVAKFLLITSECLEYMLMFTALQTPLTIIILAIILEKEKKQ